MFIRLLYTLSGCDPLLFNAFLSLNASESVSVASVVIEMIHWLLVLSPLMGKTRNRRESWHLLAEIQPVEFIVVGKVSHCFLVHVVDTENLVVSSSPDSLEHGPFQKDVGKGASGIELLERQFSDDHNG